ncbi:MAG TPA: hypothetical protein VJQ54_12165 [Candidatus Sulfotelmatobacter sp.]|nr:hypothetical protein [Candidatus Sulfotelmatobacter sp.]
MLLITPVLQMRDAAESELALREGLRLLNAYRLAGQKVWVITGAHRSCTTLLLPEEY